MGFLETSFNSSQAGMVIETNPWILIIDEFKGFQLIPNRDGY